MLEVIPAALSMNLPPCLPTHPLGDGSGLSSLSLTIRHQVRLAQAIDVTDFFVRRREVLERLYSVSADRQVPVLLPGYSGAPVSSLQFRQEPVTIATELPRFLWERLQMI